MDGLRKIPYAIKRGDGLNAPFWRKPPLILMIEAALPLTATSQIEPSEPAGALTTVEKIGA
jgi:hypothetical protein